MDPVSIPLIVGYLAKKLADNQTFKDFTSDFTEAIINWIRPIFLKPDNSPKEVLQELSNKPDSEARIKAAEAAIASQLEDDPSGKGLLIQMAEIIKQKDIQTQISIVNSKNVNTGNISAGGSVSFGDKVDEY